MRFRVHVLTYNRADLLRWLLRDLAREAVGYDVEVAIFDDASADDYSAIVKFARDRGWDYVRAEHNHGRAEHGRWVTTAYRSAKTSHADLIVHLPDDVRLCGQFFDRVRDTWNAIDDGKKLAVNILRDHVRSGACWTAVEPTDAGAVLKTGWVDGLFFAGRRYFELLDWSVPRVPLPWGPSDDLGSGVYAVISRKLCAQGNFYCVKKSLVVHLDVLSQMNPKVREKQPLHAIEFADGQDQADRLCLNHTVTAALATIPERADTLEKTVESLLPQVDWLNVYCNGHTRPPQFLVRDKIRIVMGYDHGDRGDAGKFFWAPTAAGYYFSCDDDLIYPADYVSTMLAALHAHDDQIIACVHGATMQTPIDSYYRCRHVNHCLAELKTSRPVHVPGTGTMAFHTSALSLQHDDFERPNMADVWVALAAYRQCVPVLCVAHATDWLRYQSPSGGTIYDRYKRQGDDAQTEAINRVSWGRPLLP